MDVFDLYEHAVQTPDHDVDVIEMLFRAVRRRRPRTLREDFCGTARVAIAWVESDDEREAEGVDFDVAAIRRARRHARALDADERARLRLRRADVRTPSRRTFDVVLAPNFSWAVLHEKAALSAYLDAAARALAPGGLLMLEVFGGRDLRRPLVHRHPVDATSAPFVYVWEQRAYDPRANLLDARIHFEVPGRRPLRNAFRYVFHLWTPETVRPLLEEVGLRDVHLFVERVGGGFAPVARSPRRAMWNGYVVAGRRTRNAGAARARDDIDPRAEIEPRDEPRGEQRRR
jgi:SAM-dependent methyltransferase